MDKVVEIPKLVTRIEKLQNSSKSLTWAHSVNEDGVIVLVCGHKEYRKKILTLTVRVCGSKYIILSDNCLGLKKMEFVCHSLEDGCVGAVIRLLKEIFPEKRLFE